MLKEGDIERAVAGEDDIGVVNVGFDSLVDGRREGDEGGSEL